MPTLSGGKVGDLHRPGKGFWLKGTLKGCGMNGLQSNKAIIKYADFLKICICEDDDPANFGGFRVERDGLYVIRRVDAPFPSVEDLATVSWHPTGHYDQPALALPCTVGQLRAFVAEAGLLGCIDEDELDEVVSAQSVPVPMPPVAPTVLESDFVAVELDLSLLATRQLLIDAFGKFTEMNMTWFKNLTDVPKLKAARKHRGQGGRNRSEPLFCPYEVMQWLADPRRKKGRKLSDATAWRLLKSHFPTVYALNSIGDPNVD